MGRRAVLCSSRWRDDRPTDGKLGERVVLFVGVRDTVLDDVSENILRAKNNNNYVTLSKHYALTVCS